MSFWTAIVAIVGIFAIVEIAKARHRARHDIAPDPAGEDKAIALENAELKREIEELSERIKVLERIATDDRGASRLSAEIDALRGAADKIEERSKQ
jgi:hypothetical protein